MITGKEIQLGDTIEFDGLNLGLVTAIESADGGFVFVHGSSLGWARIGLSEKVKVITKENWSTPRRAQTRLP